MRPVPGGGRGATGVLRALLRRARPMLSGTDVGWLYALAVLVCTVATAALPAVQQREVVLSSSTNVDNLREHPLLVLAVSPFVVSPPSGLWILAPLVVAYGAAQRWLGRAATAVVAAMGHVGSTLVVAVALSAGIAHGHLDPAVAGQPDVGVSYGLLAVAGLLSARLRGRRRAVYVALLVAYAVTPLLSGLTFTDAGHAVALGTGLGLALVAGRAAARAPDRAPDRGAQRPTVGSDQRPTTVISME